MPNDRYNVKLAHIFEGPMDLLIYLIKKNEVDIYDIPIALITDQYLDYMQWMTSMNIDLAGEFLLMAATLAQIKSRMLLPVHEDDPDEDDPRLEVTRPLIEYLEMKSAADRLMQRNLLGETTFLRAGGLETDVSSPDADIVRIGLFELIDAFQNVLKHMSPEHRVDLTSDGISVKKRIAQLIDIFEERGDLTFSQLIADMTDKPGVITTFLAVLEMAKVNLIQIYQHTQTGIIRIFYK